MSNVLTWLYVDSVIGLFATGRFSTSNLNPVRFTSAHKPPRLKGEPAS